LAVVEVLLLRMELAVEVVDLESSLLDIQLELYDERK
jgi:hypothetical protein